MGGRQALSRFVPALLRPGWPDEARRLIQEPIFREAAEQGSPRGRCLNAGCGEGLFSSFLESFEDVTQIINVDITPPQISVHRTDPRNTDAVGSVTALPLEDRSLDWILCTEVIEHVPDDRLAAVELGRVLEPGGSALISVPTPPAPHDPEHAREGYTLDALRTLLSHGGLDVVWHRYCFHQPMRWLLVSWRWQHQRLGRGRRSLMPRLIVRAFGQADRWFGFGRPWDLVVLARRS
ncbi:MAG: class I SAM-dependent methyltransferase [Solirubrobacteraceae bacterium]